jgi:hypothetical protein
LFMYNYVLISRKFICKGSAKSDIIDVRFDPLYYHFDINR